MEASACVGCGKAISGSDVLYNAKGDTICGACQAKMDIVRDEGRAAGNLVKAAWSSIVAALLAFFGSLAYIGVITYFFVAAAMVSAIFAIQGVSRGNERFTKHLTSGQRMQVWVCAIIGIGIGALAVLGVPGLLLH